MKDSETEHPKPKLKVKDRYVKMNVYERLEADIFNKDELNMYTKRSYGIKRWK